MPAPIRTSIARIISALSAQSWDDLGRPEGEFLVGQWQSGVPEIILPEEAATTEEILPGWNPTGGG